MRHGPLPALLAVADGHLSRRMAHMMDATNSVDELVMVGASSIEAGCQFTIRTKIDNFSSPTPGWSLDPVVDSDTQYTLSQ